MNSVMRLKRIHDFLDISHSFVHNFLYITILSTDKSILASVLAGSPTVKNNPVNVQKAATKSTGILRKLPIVNT